MARNRSQLRFLSRILTVVVVWVLFSQKPSYAFWGPFKPGIKVDTNNEMTIKVDELDEVRELVRNTEDLYQRMLRTGETRKTVEHAITQLEELADVLDEIAESRMNQGDRIVKEDKGLSAIDF